MGFLTLLLLANTCTQATPFAWVEGEHPAKGSFEAPAAAWGRTSLLSGGKWLNVSIPENEVETKVPAVGAVVSYDLQLAKTAKYEIWARIGYESARSPFEWRIAGQQWSRIEPQQLTTDLQELDTWNAVAWMKLGNQALTAGSAKLEFRLPKEKGKRVLFALDAAVATTEPFFPNSLYKPGTDYRSPRDKVASLHQFVLPAGQRELVLTGDWEISRDDEQFPPFDIAVPMTPPAHPSFWSAIGVPSDRNESRPDLIFAHRLWYRTKVLVSGPVEGKSHFLEFERNNLNTTVYVNGKYCGFEKNPLVSFKVDVSQALRTGRNEIWVGIRDAWYGYSTSPTNTKKLRQVFNYPLSVTKRGFQDLAYPIWGSFQSGILDPVRLVSTGAVYATDVFVKPNVADKRLDAEITLQSHLPSDSNVSLTIEAVDPDTGAIAKKIAAIHRPMKAGTAVTLALGGAWESATLWWPDRPKLYKLRSTVTVGDNVQDVQETEFGFRQWSASGTMLKLNGIRWRGWAELTEGETPDEFLQNYRKSGQRFMRLMGVAQNGGIRWKGLTFRNALSWMDKHGVVVRRSGEVDGQSIGYMAIEDDPELKKLYGSEIKIQLMKNWKDQMVAQVKAERNHPSVSLWSIENEFLYINSLNLYGRFMDEIERSVGEIGDAITRVDPTRLYMTDGGGAGLANRFPIHGDHYVYTNDPGQYPAQAYEDFVQGGGRGRWQWDTKRPRYLGEEFFAPGLNPADFAWIAGEAAFEGRAGAEAGVAKVQRMLQEGYRWNESYSHWQFWLGDEGASYGKHIANAQVAALVRQDDWTFGSGQKRVRTFKVHNDSHVDLGASTFEWLFQVEGKAPTQGHLATNAKAGQSSQLELTLDVPLVNLRTNGKLSFAVKDAEGKTLFEDAKPLVVLPSVSASASLKKLRIGLYDPKRSLLPILKHMGLSPQPIASLETIPASLQLVVVGPDAFDEAESNRSTLAIWAASGHRVLVLDQSFPLHGQGVPAELEPAKNRGAFAFLQDESHPIASGLRSSDFQSWPGEKGAWTYRNAYRKPTSGATSLVHCDRRLGYAAVVEIPVATGLMLLSQLSLGESLAFGGAAPQVLLNLLQYAGSYRKDSVPTTLVADTSSELAKAVKGTGVRCVPGDLEGSLSRKGIVVVDASKARLAQLVRRKAELQRFFALGGSLVLQGLNPEGLANFNQLVGVEHQIRPFRRERISIAQPRDTLAKGLQISDVAMSSSERIFPWAADTYAASDVFSYVVDLHDVAPFAALPTEYHYNTTNGFTSADGWPYVFSFELEKTKPQYLMQWQGPQIFRELEWIGNASYHLISKIELVFDDHEHVFLDVKPNAEPQRLLLTPPRTATKVEFRAVEWKKKQGSNEVVGIDNIRMFVQRPNDFFERVRSSLNIGGIVRYPQGKGNIVLCNLLFKDREDVSENGVKKQNILATVLKNLGAAFQDQKRVIAGAAGNVYTPISLNGVANQFRNEKGWFGDAAFSFKNFPYGKQAFAKVDFNVYELLTSPVPNAVMLGGPGVPGSLPESVVIRVAQKANALFFLQSARVDTRPSSQEEQDATAVAIAEYLITYSDGSSLVDPILVGVDVENYRQPKLAKELRGATLAWSQKFPDSDQVSAAYVKQWNNPHPEKEISTVTLRYGKARRGVPVLLALTAAR
jgi:hypothetical protein